MSQTREELLARAAALENKTLADIANEWGITLPPNLRSQKGFQGELLERALGAEAGNQALPDFISLGIELKTIPVDERDRPLESTFVCRAPVYLPPAFEDSVVFKKLASVLWVPILAPRYYAVGDRKVLKPFLWQPSIQDYAILKEDYAELSELLMLGKQDQITAKIGQYLQLRPKAADASVVVPILDERGQNTYAKPRGFYLRQRFTRNIIGV
jgi:DNA mismatch repair protein MutH